MHESGMITEELKPPEAPKEPGLKRAERLGRRLFFTGLGLGAISYIAPLVAATATGSDQIYDTRSGAIFGALATMTLGNLATAMTVVGGLGWLAGRYLAPFWAAVQDAARGTDRNRRLIEQQTLATDDERRELRDLVKAVPARLSALETGRAATTAELAEIRTLLTVFAKHLPDALTKAEWQGFSSAVKEGFIEQTGTEGKSNRPRHMGLVRPNEGPQQ